MYEVFADGGGRDGTRGSGNSEVLSTCDCH